MYSIILSYSFSFTCVCVYIYFFYLSFCIYFNISILLYYHFTFSLYFPTLFSYKNLLYFCFQPFFFVVKLMSPALLLCTYLFDCHNILVGSLTFLYSCDNMFQLLVKFSVIILDAANKLKVFLVSLVEVQPRRKREL